MKSTSSGDAAISEAASEIKQRGRPRVLPDLDRAAGFIAGSVSARYHLDVRRALDAERKIELAQSEHGPIPDIGRLMSAGDGGRKRVTLLAELGRYFAGHDDPWLWWLAGAIVCALLPERCVKGCIALVRIYRKHGLEARNLEFVADELGLVAHQVEGSHGRG